MEDRGGPDRPGGRHRTSIAVVLGTAATVLVALTGTWVAWSQRTTPEDEYRDAIHAICERRISQYIDLDEADSEESFRRLLDQGIASTRENADALRAMEAPEDVRDAHARAIAALDAQALAFEDYAQDVLSGGDGRAAAVEVDVLARELESALSQASAGRCRPSRGQVE